MYNSACAQSFKFFQGVRVALLQCRVVTRLACFRESIPDIRICFLRILSDAECKTRKNACSKYHHRWSKCYHTFAHCTAKTFLNRGPLMLMNYQSFYSTQTLTYFLYSLKLLNGPNRLSVRHVKFSLSFMERDPKSSQVTFSAMQGS